MSSANPPQTPAHPSASKEGHLASISALLQAKEVGVQSKSAQSFLESQKITQSFKEVSHSKADLPTTLSSNSSENWAQASLEFYLRNAEIAVVHNGDCVLPVAHCCLLSNTEIVICTNLLKLANEVATHKSGKVVILVGFVWYHFEVDLNDTATGMTFCKLIGKDEEQFKDLDRLSRENGLPSPKPINITKPIKYIPDPVIGAEFGFFHSGEANDSVWIGAEFTKLQFDRGYISHFRLPQKSVFHSFVSNVLPGRFVRAGSPVFTPFGELIGLLSDSTSYPSDAGRRAIVNCILGSKRFDQKGSSLHYLSTEC